MRRLPPPSLDERKVFEACAAGVRGAHAALLYATDADEMMGQAETYRERAKAFALSAFPSSDWGDDDQIVVGSLTKGDLTKLYTTGMLEGLEGRACYDELMASAPLEKCPFCRFGQVATLDHFMSKARYPAFSVLPSNLVPSCTDCNKGKGAGIFTSANEISHPYFEDIRIERDEWLFVEITDTRPFPTANYKFAGPGGWPADLTCRVSNYFKEFDLAGRYSVEAATELVSLAEYLPLLPSSALRLEHVRRTAYSERQLSINGWKSALYAALSKLDWYCESGYAGSRRR